MVSQAARLLYLQWANSCSPIVLCRTVSALYVMSEEGKPLIEDMYHLSQPRKPWIMLRWIKTLVHELNKKRKRGGRVRKCENTSTRSTRTTELIPGAFCTFCGGIHVIRIYCLASYSSLVASTYQATYQHSSFNQQIFSKWPLQQVPWPKLIHYLLLIHCNYCIQPWALPTVVNTAVDFRRSAIICSK